MAARSRHSFAESLGIHRNVPGSAAVSRMAKDVEDTTVGLILLWLLGIPLPIIIILLLLWH
jgi:hypothetical protein